MLAADDACTFPTCSALVSPAFLWRWALLSSWSYRSEHHEHIWTLDPIHVEESYTVLLSLAGYLTNLQRMTWRNMSIPSRPSKQAQECPSFTLCFPCLHVIQDLSFILNCLCKECYKEFVNSSCLYSTRSYVFYYGHFIFSIFQISSQMDTGIYHRPEVKS